MVIGYKKRWYKLSDVLAKTEKENFRKVFRIARERERRSEENDGEMREVSKESKERSLKPQNKDKHTTFKKL